MSSKFYAVRKGKIPGIYTDWNETSKQVSGFQGAEHKSFTTIREAQEWMNGQNTAPILSKPTPTVPSKNMTRSDKTVIYTDGSCQKELAGWAYVVVGVNGEITKESNGYLEEIPSTNNRAELSAIYFALEDIPGDLVINTDSQYSINSITQWAKGWAARGWITSQGKPVENQDLIKEILRIQGNRNIEYNHVYGHQGNVYNERCDVLAKEGVYELMKNLSKS